MSDPYFPAQQQAAQPMPGADQMGAVEVRASYFFLAFLLALFPAKASINGSAELNQGWGTTVYPMPAGRHEVRVWCPYFFLFKMGDAPYVVDVFPGQVTIVQWECPWLVFLPGKWIPIGVRPLDALAAGAPGALNPATAPAAMAAPVAGGPPPGWHPDPHGQAALRYWDGQQWTEHTNDGQPAAG